MFMNEITGFISTVKGKNETINQMSNALSIVAGKIQTEIEPISTFHLGIGQSTHSEFDTDKESLDNWYNQDEYRVLFSGELYNKNILLESLACEKNVTTAELIAKLFSSEQEQAFSKLNGHFVFFLFDKATQIGYVVRDQIGKKKVYYYSDESCFVFGSNLRSVMKHENIRKIIRKDILNRYLFHGYIAAPDTIFENVYKLKAGQYIKYSNGIITSHTYWNVVSTYMNKSKTLEKDFDKAKQNIKDLLLNSIHRKKANQAAGCFLSGGYDSSLISAMTQSISSTQIDTFSIGFNEIEFNEAVFASKIAKHIGTNHHELYITESDMINVLDEIPVVYDEPFADSSQIPSMIVAKLAKSKQNVIFSGDGSDEVFCGYKTYKVIKTAQRLDWLGALTYHITSPFGLVDKLPYAVKLVTTNRNSETKSQLRYIDKENAVRSMAGKGILEQYPIEGEIHTKQWQIKRMLVDMQTYLIDDGVTKVDSAGRYYNLDIHSPFLDQDLIEYAFHLPHNFKIHKNIGKYIVKQLTYDYIPKELLERPKKGFSIPVGDWLKNSLKEELLFYSNKTFLQEQGLFEPDYVNKFVKDFLDNKDSHLRENVKNQLLWHFYMFQKWYAYYM